MSLLEKLRNRTEAERRRLALGLAIAFTVFIIVIWGIAVALGWSDFRFSFNLSVPDDLKEIASSLKDQARGLYPQNNLSTSTDAFDIATSTVTSTSVSGTSTGDHIEAVD
jgi:hypothetical protein